MAASVYRTPSVTASDEWKVCEWKVYEWLVYEWRRLEFSSYKIELRNRIMQNDVTLQVTDSNVFI